MLRLDLDRQLGQLQQEVVSLAEIVDKATMRAVDALKRRDLVESQQVVQEDDYIDQKRYEIEERCIDLIATQQPMARDLRAIIALLHITVELERMGDYAEGISKISLLMGEEAPLKPLIDIPRMAEKATSMLSMIYTHRYTGNYWSSCCKTPRPFSGPPIFCGRPMTWSGSPTGPPTSPSGSFTWSPARWWNPAFPGIRVVKKVGALAALE